MIMVLDAGRADADLAAGTVTCPRCPGVLRPWSWAARRRVRRLDGSMLTVRPRRARCSSCHATQVLLPAGCLPRLGDTAAVVGAVLVAKADGRGARSIAAELHRPVSTVRRWLRRVRGEHVTWLRRRGVHHAHTLDPDVLTGLVPQPSPLGDAMQALAAAVVAYRRRFDHPADPWALIVVFVHGRLLTPAPAD
ncbi:hypothetical protein AB0M46_24270 [Dactylosporangium sp. NPDC051485]|uniref:helix-turn-helix domain-containing protein n=1 Tax=Dactylosporangium sp. NPDC051485 TaxID=3154846 RepID=UPI00341A48AF